MVLRTTDGPDLGQGARIAFRNKVTGSRGVARAITATGP